MEYELGLVTVHKRARLPHWEAQHAVYFLTWRLADALPVSVVQRLRAERDAERSRIAQARGSLTRAEELATSAAYLAASEAILDRGDGECVLRQRRCASIVRDALLHFDGTRYDLYAWCVMPNHVHVVVTPRPERSAGAILHSWKSFTSKAINHLLSRTGTLWQAESYDRCIRGSKELQQKITYVANNPSEADLFDWEFVAVYPERFASII